MKKQIRKEVMRVYDQEASVDEVVDKLCDLFNVRLSFFQRENCPEWIEGKGDCKKPDCTFCKIEAEIEGNEA